MDITLKRVRTYWTPLYWGLALALAGASPLACTTDEADPGPEGDTGSGGGGGASDGSGGSDATGGGGPAGTVCAASIALDAEAAGIADFEDYDPDSVPELGMWSFPLGGEVSTGVFTGPFGYGDEEDGLPETFEMVAGHDSDYALSIADTLAEEYGGGMGLWLSACLDASAFSGISFWVRGETPNGTAKLKLMMQETTEAEPETGTSVGTCEGTGDACKPPELSFEVTDEWTEVTAEWSDFVAGNAAGTAVVPDGSNVWQIQFDVELVWPDADGPEPAPYELEIDDLTFY